MKPKQSSPKKSEPRGIDFIPKMKSNEKGVAGIIEGIDSNVKHPLEDVMTLFFKALGEVHKLKGKEREGRDG